EIALRCRRRADRHRRVRHLDVQRIAVGLGVDRDRLDAHAARGLDDPAGDLDAVGDQNSLEHAAIEASRGRLRLCGGAAKMSTGGNRGPIVHMNMRGGRRAPRTWLAIHARTYASTSGELRTRAQSPGNHPRAVSRTTMGEFLIAATSA